MTESRPIQNNDNSINVAGEEEVVQLPGGKKASPPLPGKSIPSFRAMAAANIVPAAATAVSPAVSNVSGTKKVVDGGKVQFGGSSAASSGLAIHVAGGGIVVAPSNLPPRTHSAPPQLEEDSPVIVPGKKHAAVPQQPAPQLVHQAPPQQLQHQQQHQQQQQQHQYQHHEQHQQHGQQQPLPPYQPRPQYGMRPPPPHYHQHHVPPHHGGQHQQNPYGQNFGPYPPLQYPVPMGYPARPPYSAGPYQGSGPVPVQQQQAPYLSYGPGLARPPMVPPPTGQVPIISNLPPRPVSKKIAIVDPNTGVDVTKEIVKPAIIISSPSTADANSGTVASSPKKPTGVTIVNPLDNKPIDLGSPLRVTEKTVVEQEAVKEATKEVKNGSKDEVKEKAERKVETVAKEEPAVEEDTFGMDDASIFSGGELSELEGDDEEDDDLEEEEEEEVYTGPRMLKVGQHVDYPRTMVQFSPPTDGVWRYDRAFLLQFRSICTWKPEMELEKVLKARQQHQQQMRDQDGHHHHRRGAGGDREHRRRGHGGGDRQVQGGPPAVLGNRAANAWDRLGGAVLPEEEKLLREVKGMLNKLTVDKFDSISDKIIDVGIMRKSIMPGTIDLIFDKAVEEPKFASMYAKLCLKIVMHENETKLKALAELPGGTDGPAPKVDLEFRRFLISKCQVEYEKKKAWSSTRLAKLAAEKEAEEVDETTLSPEEQKRRADETARRALGELTEEDYALIKLKRRVLGNMRFIGELFNVGLIGEKIMHAVIVELLRDITNPEEEEVESLCRLFTTVGPKLDIPAAALQIASYVKRMQEMAAKTTGCLSTRVRFMVLDVLDLKAAKWAGKDKEMPKTMADFQRELEEKQAAAAAARRTGGDRRDHRDRDNRDRGDRGDHHRPGSARPASGTVHYQSGSGTNTSTTSISSRGSDRSRHGDRAGGSRGGGFQTVSNSSRPSPAMRPTGTPLSEQRPSSTAPSNASSNTAINRYDLLMSEEQPVVAPAPVVVVEAPWDSEKALSQLQSAFKELAQYRKMDDFLACWKEFIPPTRHREALSKLSNLALESGEKSVILLTEVLVALGKPALDRQAVNAVFQELCSSLDDISVDLPRAPEYIGLLMATCIDLGLLSPDDPVRLLTEVAKRDANPAIKALMHTIAAVKDSVTRSNPSALSILREHMSIFGPAAVKSGVIHRLSPALQTSIISAKLDSLPQAYEAFIQAVRPFIIGELPLAQMDQSLLLSLTCTAALRRLHEETKQSSTPDSIAEKLPTMLACLSLFDRLTPPAPSLILLNSLALAFQSVDPDWFERSFKAAHAVGLVQPEDLVAWKEDTTVDKGKALFKVSAWLETVIPAPVPEEEDDEEEE